MICNRIWLNILKTSYFIVADFLTEPKSKGTSARKARTYTRTEQSGLFKLAGACTAARCLLAPVAQDSWFTRATASYEKQNNALSLTLFANRQLGKSSTLSEFIRPYWLPHFDIPLFTPFCAGLNNTRHWNSTSNFIITPVPCSVKSLVVCQVFPWSANAVALVVITLICGFHVLQTLTERELALNIFFYLLLFKCLNWCGNRFSTACPWIACKRCNIGLQYGTASTSVGIQEKNKQRAFTYFMLVWN